MQADLIVKAYFEKKNSPLCKIYVCALSRFPRNTMLLKICYIQGEIYSKNKFWFQTKYFYNKEVYIFLQGSFGFKNKTSLK